MSPAKELYQPLISPETNNPVWENKDESFSSSGILFRLLKRMNKYHSMVTAFSTQVMMDGKVSWKRRAEDIEEQDFHIPRLVDGVRSRIIVHYAFEQNQNIGRLTIWQYDGLTQKVEWKSIPRICEWGSFQVEHESSSVSSLFHGSIEYIQKIPCSSNVPPNHYQHGHLFIVPTCPEFFLFFQHIWYAVPPSIIVPPMTRS